MPIYEFKCANCGYEYDELFRNMRGEMPTYEAQCPECKHLTMWQRMPTTFNFRMG